MVTLTFVRHASSSSKNQRCKRSPFYLKNSRRVKALFIILVKLVNLLQGEILVRVCVRVAYPNIKERRLFSRPEAPCTDIHPRILLVPLGSTSPVTSWRTGFISTSLHTACRIPASRSRISLCRCIIYPPRIQIKAWSASNKSPQTHTVGMSLNSQPYLNFIASLNSLLLRVKFISLKGGPFLLYKFTARWVLKSRDLVTYFRSRRALSAFS